MEAGLHLHIIIRRCFLRVSQCFWRMHCMAHMLLCAHGDLFFQQLLPLA